MNQVSTNPPGDLRWVCCIHSLAGGGAERLMAGLAGRLAERHPVTLLTLDSADRDRYPVDARVERVGLGVMGESRSRIQGAMANMHRVHAVRDAIEARRPSAVLSFCDQMNVVVLAATRPLRIPTVVTEFTDPRYQRLPMVWQGLRRALYPTAALGVALNQTTLPIVRRWIRGPVAVISAAVDPPPPGFAHAVASDGRKRLVGVGRLSREKGFDRLIESFGRIADQCPDWNLEIAGDGPDRAGLDARIRELGMTDRIQLIGWLKDVWGFLAKADAFALTSRYDGYPVALLEAMAGGIPCISMDCESGPREIIRHGVTGVLTENDDTRFAANLAEFLNDEPLRRKLSQASPEVLERLSWQRFTDDYEQVLIRASRRDRSEMGLPGLQQTQRTMIP